MTQRRSRLGLVIVVVVAVLAWLAVMVWIALQPERTEGSLGVDDETDAGAAAMTRVLEGRGIAVRPAQSMTQLEAELGDRKSVV